MPKGDWENPPDMVISWLVGSAIIAAIMEILARGDSANDVDATFKSITHMPLNAQAKGIIGIILHVARTYPQESAPFLAHMKALGAGMALEARTWHETGEERVPATLFGPIPSSVRVTRQKSSYLNMPHWNGQ